ncbi:DUF2269 family protein [Hamadaea tsunoensis]|uniref:DUF2269 family protein n=1 Tax=Hamadaea tsunoensis TaxID=53368 RepID=UPI001FE1CC6F|nr:DUF2269 family protein [Hamadaea tsunoensis]
MTFVKALHVLSAVMLIGPLMSAPFVGRRAIARRSADGVRAAANQMSFYGLGSILTALLGVLTVSASGGKVKFGDPWVIISSTLYVVALGLVFFYAVPALRKAANMVAEGVLEATPDTAALTATGGDLQLKERLDAITGRVYGAGIVVLLAFALITLLMTIRPF